MKNIFKPVTVILLTCICLNVTAQKKSEVILKLGNEKVTVDEFIANYKKNNTNILDEKDRKTPAEYLDLYTNFRLKVLEAKRLGYDTIRSFVEELKGYRAELAKPYLTDVTFNEEMVQTAYHRTKYERKASHILIRTEPESDPADTLAAWNKINDLRDRILNGADFNEIASTYSEDPSAVQNNGLLGYFSAFQMVYPFEDMTYKTPVGQVSEIIRTRFGYHLIKVHDERLSPGEIKVAHIMKMFPQQASDETIANLKLAADSIWQKANSGEDFAELARQYSDDKQSAGDGGVMNWFSPTNMVPSFAEAAFELKSDGEISPVIRTPFGWHIIKRLELKTTPPFEKLRPDLEAKIKHNPAISIYSDEAFDRKLRAEYNFKLNSENFKQLIQELTDTLLNDQTKTSDNEKVLFTFADQSVQCNEFVSFLAGLEDEHNHNHNHSHAVTGIELEKDLDKFINTKLLAYEDTQLEKKHEAFARVYQEYYDGILLFNISKDKIWDVASNDTLRLQNYYDQTQKKYYWNERFKGWIINTSNSEIRTKVESLLDQKTANKQEINDLFNTPTENNVVITEVAAEKGDHPVVDYYIWSGPKPAGFDETTTFVHGEKVQNEIKTLKDAWGLYSSDFQEQIEKEWIESLKKKYPIKINRKALQKIPMAE